MDLEAVWQRLGEVKMMNIRSNCFRFPPTYPKREGKGKVIPTESGESLVFCEKGQWQDAMRFTNIFRWTFDRENEEIVLEHMRFGTEKPVYLFALTPSGPDHLKSIAPHECGDDLYSGQLAVSDKTLELSWRIQGPNKNQEVITVYS